MMITADGALSRVRSGVDVDDVSYRSHYPILPFLVTQNGRE